MFSNNTYFNNKTELICKKYFTSYIAIQRILKQSLSNIESTFRDVVTMFAMLQFNISEILIQCCSVLYEYIFQYIFREYFFLQNTDALVSEQRKIMNILYFENYGYFIENYKIFYIPKFNIL